MGLYNLILAVGVDQQLEAVAGLSSMVFLYIGPDQMMPLASVLGAIVGLALILWHRIAALGHKAWQFFTKKQAGASSEGLTRTPIAGASRRIGKEKTN
jgi:hypothetical protein